jgi:hypothetical protein
MELSKEQLHEILETFADSIQRRKPIVFCVQCGSTSIDQNFINELRCYKCGNSLAWNGYRFSISREQDFSDITHSLQTIMRDEFSEWHIEMEQTTGEFIKAIVGDCVHPSETPAERMADIEKQWIECKEKIDELIARRKSEILG